MLEKIKAKNIVHTTKKVVQYTKKQTHKALDSTDPDACGNPEI